MDSTWLSVPVLVHRQNGADIGETWALVNELKVGDAVQISRPGQSLWDRACRVFDRKGRVLGVISGERCRRFETVYGTGLPLDGEFAGLLQFGWAVRIRKPSLPLSFQITSQFQNGALSGVSLSLASADHNSTRTEARSVTKDDPGT